jgi:hypothetical protein
VPVEPIGDDNPIEAILLTAFPNPERIGCPSAEMIKAMANQQIGRDDPAWNHLWNCSPCFKDFKVVRDARVARIGREYERKRTRRSVLIGAATAAACSGLAYFAALEFRSRPGHHLAIISVDLTEAGTTRGVEEQTAIVARLPRQVDEIHLTLPRLSPSGTYIVAVLGSESENTAVALSSAATQITAGQRTLIVTLDLSQVRAGRYFLGTRLQRNGHQEEPSFYPVLIAD